MALAQTAAEATRPSNQGEGFDEIQGQLEHSTGPVAAVVQEVEFNVATGAGE